MSSPRAAKLRDRIRINPDAPETAPAPEPEPAPEPPQPVDTAPEPPPAPEDTPAPSEPAPRPRKLRKAAEPLPLCTEDPDIPPGKKDYRSFYAENSYYARFRAAIYWLSRNPQAMHEVPDNMSVAVEEFMRDTAAELEKRYNDGEVFPMPPPTRRKPKRAR